MRLPWALDVRLPQDYRYLLLNFPVRYSVGTTNEVLWDDPQAVISRNRELRSERRSLGVQYQSLPEHFLFVGEDGGGWQFLIDLREQPSIAHVMEFENIDKISPSMSDDGKPQSINDWLHDHLLELKNDGIDIHSETAPDYSMGWFGIICVIGFCLLMAMAVALMVLGFQSFSGGP